MLVGPFGQSFQLEGLGFFGGFMKKPLALILLFMGAFFWGYFELGRFHHHELLDVGFSQLLLTRKTWLGTHGFS